MSRSTQTHTHTHIYIYIYTIEIKETTFLMRVIHKKTKTRSLILQDARSPNQQEDYADRMVALYCLMSPLEQA